MSGSRFWYRDLSVLLASIIFLCYTQLWDAQVAVSDDDGSKAGKELWENEKQSLSITFRPRKK